MSKWMRLSEVVQSREAVHTVDISVPETLQVIHKSCPSTYKAGLELALSSTCLKPYQVSKDANAWTHLVGFFT